MIRFLEIPPLRSPRLPQFEAIAFGIGGPTETAIVVVFDPVVDRDTRGPELRQHGVDLVILMRKFCAEQDWFCPDFGM